GETERRRAVQETYNEEHHITPASIVKEIRDLTDRLKSMIAEDEGKDIAAIKPEMLPKEELHKLIKELEKEMKKAAQALEFEKAAALRDQLFDLRGALAEKDLEGDLLMR